MARDEPMWDEIVDLYGVLYKLLGPSLDPEGEEAELLEELESGWVGYPKDLSDELRGLRASVAQLKERLDSGLDAANPPSAQRELLDTLRAVEGNLSALSSTFTVVSGDVESVLDRLMQLRLVPDALLRIDTLDYEAEILSNDASSPDYFSEDSFLSILHEDGVWDFNAYWRFDLALFALAANTSMATHPHLYQALFRSVQLILLYLGCSLDPRDGYEIRNLDYDSHSEVRERLSVIMNSVCAGQVPENDHGRFRNPYL